jgi:hypothetical protein
LEVPKILEWVIPESHHPLGSKHFPQVHLPIFIFIFILFLKVKLLASPLYPRIKKLFEGLDVLPPSQKKREPKPNIR